MRARLYTIVFTLYRQAPFNSRRGDLWWFLANRIDRTAKGRWIDWRKRMHARRD